MKRTFPLSIRELIFRGVTGLSLGSLVSEFSVIYPKIGIH